MFDLAKETAALSRWPQSDRTAALKRILPRAAVKEALDSCGCDRFDCKRMPGWLVVWFVVGLGLFASQCYRQIYRRLRPWDKKQGTPPRSTLCEARKRIGVRPLVKLAAKVIKPLAQENQPWAKDCFYAGMPLMGVDGFVINLPDTPDNARVFGRPGGASPGAFPQARALGLCELGTHAIVNWLVKPISWGEPSFVLPLLKKLKAGSLLLWDQNFRRYDLVKAVLEQKAHLLARGRMDQPMRRMKSLSDGSYLAKIYPKAADRNADRKGLLVRVIDYALDDPARCGEKGKRTQRLITTLLDEKAHPAKTLVELYHSRWEEELAIDEIKTHELSRTTLRSQTPGGVVQELWGLLLAHYVVRHLMCKAAAHRGLPPLRISFTGTLEILQSRLAECPRSAPAQRQWWKDLVEEVSREIIEPRRDRMNPRVIRVQRSKWPRKRKKHYDYPQPTKKFRACIVIQR